MWGNGKQTRSFCYIDDAVEGILRLMVRRRRRRHAIPAQLSAAQTRARNSAISPRNSPACLHHTSPRSSPQASDYKKPLNVGSDEMVSMNQMADLVKGFAGKAELPTKHIPGPEGVRGRNSDNTLIKQVLGWAPQTTLKEGLGITYKWIEEQVGKYGADTKALTTSTVVGQTMTDSCDMGKAAGK